MAEKHLCVGPTCWECGEPTELREMRHSMVQAFSTGKVANSPQRLAQIATNAIRGDVIAMMAKIEELKAEIHLLGRDPLTRVEIDPNVRVRGNQTVTGLKDVHGPIAVGNWVRAFESEAGIEGDAWVTDIDQVKGLVYLNVVWSSLKPKEKKS